MTWAWPTMNRHGLELAACEAVTNAIEHAYPTRPSRPGRLPGRRATGRYLQARVSDGGRWREPHTDAGGRGHGLMLTGQLVDELQVRHPPHDPAAGRCAEHHGDRPPPAALARHARLGHQRHPFRRGGPAAVLRRDPSRQERPLVWVTVCR
jgi:hypothetical protein